MSLKFFEGREYRDESFVEKALPPGVYEECSFLFCDFSGSDLGKVRLIECSFTGCNLSNASLKETIFREVEFNDCKMLGLFFSDCDPTGLSFSFDRCILNHSSFCRIMLERYGLNLES